MHVCVALGFDVSPWVMPGCLFLLRVSHQPWMKIHYAEGRHDARAHAIMMHVAGTCPEWC